MWMVFKCVFMCVCVFYVGIIMYIWVTFKYVFVLCISCVFYVGIYMYVCVYKYTMYMGDF